MKNNYHVHVQPDGTVTVFDFNNHRTRYPNEEGLPMWMQEKMAPLRMVKTGNIVDGVGAQAWREGFYLDPPEDDKS